MFSQWCLDGCCLIAAPILFIIFFLLANSNRSVEAYQYIVFNDIFWKLPVTDYFNRRMKHINKLLGT